MAALMLCFYYSAFFFFAMEGEEREVLNEYYGWSICV